MPGSASAVIATAAGRTAPVSFTVARAAVGIFASGADRAIALNQDGSVNSSDNPESRGRAVVCFVSGLGSLAPAVPTGETAPSDTLSNSVEPVTATVGGVAANAFFAGLTAGFIGLGQVNLVIPGDAPVGDAVPVTIQSAGQTSEAATIAIR